MTGATSAVQIEEGGKLEKAIRQNLRGLGMAGDAMTFPRTGGLP
jgi:hypothetical protein